MLVRFRRQNWRRAVSIGGATVIAPFLGGCANTWDNITSKHFRDDPIHWMFHTDDPMWVLRNVEEGDRRAKAMLAVKEPKTNGGSIADQEELMKILSESAVSDKHSICRLNAIEALSRFQDPRAVAVLVSAYHHAAVDANSEATIGKDGRVIQTSFKSRSSALPVPSFTPDQVITIQCRALEALGKQKSQEGLDLLCEVAATPPKKEVKTNSVLDLSRDPLNSWDLGQDRFDLRQAAIRSLENYKGDAKAARVLYTLMLTEREVAPKNRARLSLMKVTDKDWAWDSPEWPKFLKVDAIAPPKPPVFPAQSPTPQSSPAPRPLPAQLQASPPPLTGQPSFSPPSPPTPQPSVTSPLTPQPLQPSATSPLPPPQPSATSPFTPQPLQPPVTPFQPSVTPPSIQQPSPSSNVPPSYPGSSTPPTVAPPTRIGEPSVPYGYPPVPAGTPAAPAPSAVGQAADTMQGVVIPASASTARPSNEPAMIQVPPGVQFTPAPVVPPP